MATNKNQHFVPRCYLKAFSHGQDGAAINLFNLDRRRFVRGAPVKNQCSGDYFYGHDLKIEKGLQIIEGMYARTVTDIQTPGYTLSDDHRNLLRRFWLLQYLRTEAASQRSLEMTQAMGEAAGVPANEFRMGIKEAVQETMGLFVTQMYAVDDLKVCLLRNHTAVPFITSDNPAILTNPWHLDSPLTKGRSFGLKASGIVCLLPLTPRILCIAFDGDMHSVPHENGWVRVSQARDVEAFNEYQFLNCEANIFVKSDEHSELVNDAFLAIASHRPKTRHILHYAVFDRDEGDWSRYAVVDRAKAEPHERALIHIQALHPRPTRCPSQLRARSKRFAYENGTGLGYIRRWWVQEFQNSQPFRRVSV